MSMVSRAGRYLARPTSWGIKQEEGKCPRFAMVFECTQLLDGNEWVGVENESITGFFTLFNKDDSPNEINLRSLREALGWDGASLSTLETSEWTKIEVQIVVEPHEYNGKSSYEVRYLNPRDYVPGIKKADAQTVQSLDQKYGAVLRALFKDKPSPARNGSSPAPAPARAATATATAVAPPSGIDTEKAKAWRVFSDVTPTYDKAKRADIFKKLLQEIVPHKVTADFTAEDWHEVTARIGKDFDEATETIIPLTETIIPF